MNLKALFLDNLSLKVLALVLAAGCWFYVQMLTAPEAENFSVRVFHDIPVRILTSHESKLTVTPMTDDVAIAVRGNERHLRKLRQSDIAAYLEVSGLEPGVWDVGLQVMVPKEVTVESKPASIRVEITAGDRKPPEGKP